jgi:hypothetical protein
LNDQAREHELNKALSTHEGRMHEEYCWEKPEGKTPLGRPRRRWMDSINMDLRKIGWGSMDCIDLG